MNTSGIAQQKISTIHIGGVCKGSQGGVLAYPTDQATLMKALNGPISETAAQIKHPTPSQAVDHLIDQLYGRNGQKKLSSGDAAYNLKQFLSDHPEAGAEVDARLANHIKRSVKEAPWRQAELHSMLEQAGLESFTRPAVGISKIAGAATAAGVVGPTIQEQIAAQPKVMAELKALGASPAMIAAAEQKFAAQKAMGAAQTVGQYARDTGKHIKPQGGIDFAGVRDDSTAPPAVRAAASQVLKYQEKLAKENPTYAATLTLQKYADDTGRHILPNHGGLDLAGIKGDNTAPPAVRKAASDMLAERAHSGTNSDRNVAGAAASDAAIAISP